MSAITAGSVAQRRSFQEVWVISLGHALTHWYPATFYLLLPLIGKELGLSYGEIGSILTAQYAAGAIANIPGGIFVELGRPQGSADGAVAIVDRHPVPDHGRVSHLLDDSGLRDAGRCRQQHLAPDRDPVARRPFPRAQGTGDVLSRHGRQCRRRRCTAGGRLTAANVQLAHRRVHERDPWNGGRGLHPDLCQSFATRGPSRRHREDQTGDEWRGADAHAAGAAAQPRHGDAGDRVCFPHHDAGRAADLPSALSGAHDGLFIVLGRRLHVRACRPRASSLRRSLAICRIP